MTARLLPGYPESSVAPQRVRGSQHGSNYAGSLPRTVKSVPSVVGRVERPLPSASADQSFLWSMLVESLAEGVMVISRDLKLVYTNAKARSISQKLLQAESYGSGVPSVVHKICSRLIQAERSLTQPLVVEYQTTTGQVLRLRACFPPAPQTESGQSTPILVFLEDRSETLQEELRIEQKKYDLTDREAEISMLLRQDYTYQEIASKLQISLNTVKTHVKKVYSKRRSCLGQDMLWCSE